MALVSTPETRFEELHNSRHFEFLDLPALKDLALHVQEFSFEEGDVVYFGDEESEGAILVLSGCLEEHGGKNSSLFFGPGEFWQKERLWLSAPVTTVLKGKTSGRFFLFPRAAFVLWLRRFPQQIPLLVHSAPPETTPWDEKSLSRFLVRMPTATKAFPHLLEEGEYPRYRFSRARVYSGLRLFLPLFFLIQALAYAVVLQIRWGESVSCFFLMVIPTLIFLVSSFFVILFWWENRCSFLLLTNRSLIMRQLHLWERRSEFQKIPLDKIREARTAKQGLFAFLFRLVDVEIDTDSSSGKLIFKGMSRGSSFLQELAQAQNEALSFQRLKKTQIRSRLEAQFGPARKPKKLSQDPVAHRRKEKRFSWRTEKQGRISFRRHPWTLFKNTSKWWGLFFLILFVGSTAWAVWGEPGFFIFLLALFTALIPGGRFFWAWLDWTNDSLYLENDKIVMVHKKPLWMKEVRQEGSLLQIQQIGIRKESFMAIALDYGDLVIHLGGGDPLVFEYASHPEGVQNEIFQRQQDMNDNRKKREAENRVEEVSEILKTYEEAKAQDYFDPKKKE